MSIQLTLARAGAADAESRWREHKVNCPGCSMAQRHRQPGQMCGQGAGLYADMKDWRARLSEERKLEKRPIPGQGELF